MAWAASIVWTRSVVSTSAMSTPGSYADDARSKVEDLAGLDAPVHELSAEHVVREEVGEIDKVVAVRVELGRLLVAKIPVGAKPALLRQRGDVHGVPIPCVDHPDRLVRQDIDMARREPDLLAQLPERGLVWSLVAVPPAAEILPNAAGAPHQGAVLAHDEDAGTREAAIGVDAGVERGVRSLFTRRATRVTGAEAGE